MHATERESLYAAISQHDHLPTMEKMHSEILDAFHRLSYRSSDGEGILLDDNDDSSFNIKQEIHCSSRDSLKERYCCSEDLGETPSSFTTPESLDAESRTTIHRPRLSKTERRICEATLFYDAVGEEPPTSPSDLERLIDDDDEIEDCYPDLDSLTGEENSSVEKKADQGLTFDSSPDPALSDVSASSSASGSPPRQRPRSLSLPNPFLHRLPGEVRTESFRYKGLHANPPDVVYRGTSRGNYSSLHRKAWLESADTKHRYGKNLRLYYRHWESLGFPTDIFFDWLDSKGDAAGQPLPELVECPRNVLDNDRVNYITDMNVTRRYALSVVPDEQGRGIVFNADQELVRTGPDGWIFVLRDDVMYGAKKVASVEGNEKRRFHHSSFFGGKAVAAAGILVTDENGILKQAFPHSGHYRPGEAEVQRMLFYFFTAGVDLHTFDVDIQQIIHLDRHSDCKHDKQKKRESLHLRPATVVANYLSHKARSIDLGVFEQLHKLQLVDSRMTVREALREID